MKEFTQDDLDNLRFLLTADRKTLADWESKMDQDDLDYADELIESYTKYLRDTVKNRTLH